MSPWFISGSEKEYNNNKISLIEQKNELIDTYKKTGLVKSLEVFETFSNVPREEFLPKEYRKYAYLDRPLPLFNTGQTISAPHMTIMILEYLKLFKNQIDENISYPISSVLEIGGGSGYQAALIAEALMHQSLPFKVYSIEIVPTLVKYAKLNLQNAGYEDHVEILEGDGTLGFEEYAPFDRILLTAAGPKIPPPLINQLRVGGILCMPLGGAKFWQTMIRIIKKDDEGTIQREDLTSVAFVPLRGVHGV